MSRDEDAAKQWCDNRNTNSMRETFIAGIKLERERWFAAIEKIKCTCGDAKCFDMDRFAYLIKEVMGE